VHLGMRNIHHRRRLGQSLMRTRHRFHSAGRNGHTRRHSRSNCSPSSACGEQVEQVGARDGCDVNRGVDGAPIESRYMPWSLTRTGFRRSLTCISTRVACAAKQPTPRTSGLVAPSVKTVLAGGSSTDARAKSLNCEPCASHKRTGSGKSRNGHGPGIRNDLSASNRAQSAETGGSKEAGYSAVPNVALAQAFNAALNAHDVDGLVQLFTDEDSGPTVFADRQAWQKFEIRLWAQHQADMNIRLQAYDYTATEVGASWEADVYRDDWSAAGVPSLAVTDFLSIHEGRLASFISVPRSDVDLGLLGDLWRSGAFPDPQCSDDFEPTSPTLPNDGSSKPVPDTDVVPHQIQDHFARRTDR
jgi:hypothetical protein